MNGFERRRKEKMEIILNTAFELFFTFGIKNVSIAQIAEKANVSQVSIYNFFESKDNLVRQSVFAYFNGKLHETESLLNSELSFKEKLEKLMFIKASALDQYGEQLMQPDLWNQPLIQSFIEEYFNTYSLPLMIKFIEQGKMEGFIDSEFSNESILLYISMFKDLIYKYNLSQKTYQDLTKLSFYGLLGKSI